MSAYKWAKCKARIRQQDLLVEDHFPYRSCASQTKKVGQFHQAAVVIVQLRLELLVGLIHKHGYLKIVMILT